MKQHMNAFINMKSNIGVKRTSAEIVASIDDLVTEILLRLPMKTLIRFKIVSKKWRSLITNPHFSILRNPPLNPAIGLFIDQSDGVHVSATVEYVSLSTNKPTNSPLTKLSFTEEPMTGIRILKSCNGLLLCFSFNAEIDGFIPTYYVFNPTTKTFSTLPKLEQGNDQIFGMTLAFDPSKSPHYKAVCVHVSNCNSGDTNMHQLEIYSSEKGQWRKCGEPFTTAGNLSFNTREYWNGLSLNTRVYWNGAIHWINDSGRDSLCFNVDDDDGTPRVMPLPPLPDEWVWRNNYYFGESCDHLHFIDAVVSTVHLDVYEMKRDYSEWFVKYKVDLSPLVASYPEMDRDCHDQEDWNWHGFSIFSVVRGEKDEDSFLVIQIPGRVVRYNLACGSFEIIHEYEGAELEVTECSLRYLPRNVFQYIESLSCV